MIQKYGGRGRLKREHIAPYFALGKSSLNPEKYASLRQKVAKHIDELITKELVSVDPELRCTLGPGEDSILAKIVEQRTDKPLLLKSLVPYVFGTLLPPLLHRGVMMTNSDDSIKAISGSYQENLRGLLVKVIMFPMVFTAFIGTNDDLEVENLREAVNELADPFARLGIISIRTSKIPARTLSLFPMTSVLTHLDSKLRRIASQRYFDSVGREPESALKSWYEDYLQSRREIIERVPDLDLFVGSMLLSKHASLLYDRKREFLYERELVSAETRDSVEIRIEEIESLDKLDKGTQPPSVSLISETRHWSSRPDFYLDWDHPYIKALNDTKENIRELSLKIGIPSYDASIATTESLKSWSEQEVNEIRYVSEKLRLQDELAEWLRPLRVYIAYLLNEPQKHRVLDGLITRRFFIGQNELYLAQRVRTEARESGWVNFEEAFPKVKERTKLFRESNSRLLSYLGPIMGDPHSIY
jgi:hypothetical protein